MRNITKAVVGTTTSLALSAAIVGAIAGTATADASNAGTVFNLTVCTDSWSGGNCTKVPGSVGDALKQVGSGYQDTISSINNNTGEDICFYENNNFQGSSVRVAPGYVGDLSQVRGLPSYTFMNDNISSWRPYPGYSGINTGTQNGC